MVTTSAYLAQRVLALQAENAELRALLDRFVCPDRQRPHDWSRMDRDGVRRIRCVSCGVFHPHPADAESLPL